MGGGPKASIDHEQQQTHERAIHHRGAFPGRNTGIPWAAATLAHCLGNHYLQRLLQSRVLQAKLTVSDPGDAFEQEADRVADQVSGSAGSLSPRRAALHRGIFNAFF